MFTGHKISSSVKYKQSGVFSHLTVLRQKRARNPINIRFSAEISGGVHPRNRGKLEIE